MCVDTAYSCDPRVKRFKEEEKAEKLAKKRAKEEAARQEAQERERVSQMAIDCIRASWCVGLCRQRRKGWRERELRRSKEKLSKRLRLVVSAALSMLCECVCNVVVCDVAGCSGQERERGSQESHQKREESSQDHHQGEGPVPHPSLLCMASWRKGAVGLGTRLATPIIILV